MKIEVTFQPTFHLPLALADVQLLRYLADRHHDSDCKSAGDPGGFLFDWSSLLSPRPKAPAGAVAATVCASLEDIEVTTIVLERRPLLAEAGRVADLKRANELSAAMFAVLERWPHIKPPGEIIDTAARPTDFQQSVKGDIRA